MTMDAPARRLLALLVDEQAIETEPIAEIRADLAALGLDSTRAVALARRLAAGASSPAVALLERIAGSEADDDEIRRLESADLSVIRQRLGEGTVAAAVAKAQRAAGSQSTVVGLRRRRPRRLLYGLGGVAAALAATVVFYVGLSTDRLHRDARDKVSALKTVTGPAPTVTNETDSLRAPTTTPADEPYGSVVDPQARALPQGPTATEAADAESLAKSESGAYGTATGSTQSQAPASPSVSPDEQSASAASSRIAAGSGLADSAQEEANEQEPGRNLQSLNQPAASGEQFSQSFSPRADQISAEELRAAVRSKNASLLFGLAQPVTELLIVNPRLMPPDVKQEDYSVGDLRARLDDARNAAVGRSIVALVTVRRADRSHDAVVIVKPFEIDFDAGEQKVQEQLVDAIRSRRAYQIIELDDR